MSVATATDGSLLASYRTDSRILTEHPCNMLVEGAVDATDAVLCFLQPHLREAIVWHQSPAPLDLPSGETRALILRHAASLSRDDQRRLLAWMGDAGSRTRIISTTARPLFALVVSGLFDAALYYRLNVMLVRVSAAYHPAWLGDGAGGVPRRFDNQSTVSPPPLT
jgi:Sigma-54 interaction domain